MDDRGLTQSQGARYNGVMVKNVTWAICAVAFMGGLIYLAAVLMISLGTEGHHDHDPKPPPIEYKLPPVIYQHSEKARRDAWVRFVAARASLYTGTKAVVRDADLLLLEMDQRDFSPKGDNGT